MKLLFMFLSLLHLSAGDPRLVCPETVETRIGDNVVLPCHLEPEENIQHETIVCKLADSNQLVYARRNGKELPDQLARYKHRTSLDFEDLKVGVLNLKINSVTQSDNAMYQFYIHKWSINSKVNLIVGVPPSGVPPSGVPPSGVPPSGVPPSGVPPSRVPPSGDPRLVCPETVETRIGDNVTLSCHLEPEENIQHEAVEVTKVDPAALVYAYINGKQFADFYEPYKHRTSLNIEELKSGVVNLKIFSVRESDKGKYRIYISTWRINSIVNLVVGNPLLVCQEMVEAQFGDDVTLPCHVEPKQSIEDETITCSRADSEVLVYAYSNRKQSLNQENQNKQRMFLNFEDLKVGVLNLKINSVRESDNGTFNIYIHTWRINSTVTLIVGVPHPGFLVFYAVTVVVCVIFMILVKHKLLRIHVFTLLLLHLLMLTLYSLLSFSDDCCPLDVLIGVTKGVFVVFAVVTLGVILLLVKTCCDLACWSETMRRRRRVLASHHRAEDPPRART